MTIARGPAGTARLDPRRGGRALVRGPAPQRGRRGPAVGPARRARGNGKVEELVLENGRQARLRRGRRRHRRRSRGGLAGRQRSRARWRADRRGGPDLDPRRLRRRRRDAVIRPAIRRARPRRALGRRRSPGRRGRARRCSATIRARRRCRASGATSTGFAIQYVGHAEHADDVRFECDRDGRELRAVYTRDERPIAALVVDQPRALIALRREIELSHNATATRPRRRTNEIHPHHRRRSLQRPRRLRRHRAARSSTSRTRRS